jgi:hypothetical protein
MTSQFYDIVADLNAAVSEAYGEVVRIVPRRDGQYIAPTSDTDRQPVEVVAAFTNSPGIEFLAGGRRGSEMVGGTRLAVTEATLWIGRENYEALGFEIVKGDRIELISREGWPAYSVAAAQKGHVGDINFLLIRDGER